ncbi:universal stress protein [Leeuwenhoekiella nanhaiensis]|uniref:Universal stress protein n=1 Tax=Leeuwenhoekiella nanhaiensis TaxID=1655491 RepID=A0A2G1VQP5_9FLAO|nr:universal stress protein [Leeuwenhoekiella nanhaiensis]PHQ29097.1 universal stress protein [Leeuwenhoekiella nanhaiensis]
MESIKNIMVALDLSSMDNHLIEYSSFLADKLNVEQVYFIHNIKKYEISELFDEELKKLNLDQIIGDELNEKVESRYTASAPWEVLISEDSNTESLIHYTANKYQIDLVLLGNKSPKKGTGVVPSKLLRLLKCSILSIPKTAQKQLEKIWVGTDFSAHSRKSFALAEMLKNKLQVQLNAVHVYHVPIQFSPYVTREDAAQKIEKHLQQKAIKFVKKLNTNNPDELHLIYAKESSVIEKFTLEIEKQKPDLIILSDKGSNNISSLLIGSLTEELFEEHLSRPLLVVK